MVHDMLGQFTLADVIQFYSLFGVQLDNESAEKCALSLLTVSSNTTVLMIFNPGNHWILIAIEMIDWTVIYIDPLWGGIRKEFRPWMEK